MVVAAILLFYVVLGAVMDELSMILLTIPIFFPMIMGLDFGMPKDSVAIWFGIMVLMTVGFGLLAPPVGPERVCGQRHGQGRADRRKLPRRDAVPGQRRDAHRPAAAVPGHFAVAGQVRRVEGKPPRTAPGPMR